MTKTKLIYKEMPVFLDKDNFLFRFQDGEMLMIYWENLPLIKGDSLLEMMDGFDSKVTHSNGKIQVNKEYINKIL